MKKIAFMLPRRPKGPVGGYKVVYEYANRLARDGFEVTLVYPVSLKRRGLEERLRLWYYRITGKYKCDWFPLDPQVREVCVIGLQEKYNRGHDIYVATAVETAGFLNIYDIPESSKFYFIQGFEDWNLTAEEVIATYHYPMRRIVISSWLHKLIRSVGESSELIPNGFDFSCFHKDTDPAGRSPSSVAITYHSDPGKGFAEGMKALQIVRDTLPELEVTVFGAAPRPDDLPSWTDYRYRPGREELNRIYNEAAVFLAPSRNEGWGLTVGEAMICGAAVVCTDNPGYLEMAEPGKTALVVTVGDHEAMAREVIRLLKDKELRVRLAGEASEKIASFTWDSSYDKLKYLFLS